MVGDLDPRDDKRGVGGGLIMVGGLVRRYDSEGGGRCTLQAQYERQGGGGSCLAEEGKVPYMKGQLYDLLNSECFTMDYNDFRNFIT